MLESVRVFVNVFKKSHYHDNDLGEQPCLVIKESGYIFQSDQLSDDEVMALLVKCYETDSFNDYLYGRIFIGQIEFFVQVWLSSPALDSYPLLEESDNLMKMLMEA